jgi:hypothetical protein
MGDTLAGNISYNTIEAADGLMAGGQRRALAALLHGSCRGRDGPDS